MVAETKAKSSNATTTATGGFSFRSKMKHYLHSGEKKHVFAGIVIISAVFAVPWYYMTRGAKQMSHQDYLEKAEKADKARSDRLSSASK